MKINKERAIYLAAVAQGLGVAQFSYFAGDSLKLLLAAQGLPGSMNIVAVCSLVYIVMSLIGYFLLSDRFIKR